MFFVSEEFLRDYVDGDKIVQTIDEAVLPREGLFANYESKADWKAKRKASNKDAS